MSLQNLMPVAACLTMACALAACRGQPASRPAYSISVDGAGNRVTAIATGSEALFEVESETGLGAADITQTAGNPPEQILTRLHLKGLEEFDFEYDDVVVVVSVSSHGDQSVSERLRTGGSVETAITPDSPHWMPVRVVGSPAPGSRDSTGYFEVQAPQAFVKGQHSAFSMRWIDFYR